VQGADKGGDKGKPEKAAEWSRKLEGSRVAAGQKP